MHEQAAGVEPPATRVLPPSQKGSWLTGRLSYKSRQDGRLIARPPMRVGCGRRRGVWRHALAADVWQVIIWR